MSEFHGTSDSEGTVHGEDVRIHIEPYDAELVTRITAELPRQFESSGEFASGGKRSCSNPTPLSSSGRRMAVPAGSSPLAVITANRHDGCAPVVHFTNGIVVGACSAASQNGPIEKFNFLLTIRRARGKGRERACW